MWTGAPGEFRPPRWASPQPRLEDGTPWPTAGRLVGRWIERYLVHGEGDALGQRVRLGLVWWYILARLFEYDPQTGRLAHDRALIGMGKGGAKTERAAQIGITELCGPIAPLRAPRVVLSASSYDQTQELFQAARLGILGDPEHDRPGPLAEYFRDGEHILEDRILLPDGVGRLERTAAVGGTNDGGKPTAWLGDELHEYDTERKQRQYTVHGKSLAKRAVPRRTPAELNLPRGMQLSGSLRVGISTAGAHLDSLLGRLYEHGTAVASGQVADPGFLFLWWEADEHWDRGADGERLDGPELEHALRQAILAANPTAGDFSPVEGIVSSYRDPTIPKVEFIRYNLNRFPGSALSWMPDELWEACQDEQPLDAALPVFASVVVDHDHRAAAVAIAQRQGENVLLRAKHFLDDDLPDGEYLPLAKVEAHLMDLHARYPAAVVAKQQHRPGGRARDIAAPGPEVSYHGTFFERSAQGLRDRGLVMVDVPPTQERLAPAAESLMELAIAGKLMHDGDPELARQMGRVNAKEATRGWTLAPSSGTRIVAAKAAIVAVHQALTAKQPPKRVMHIGGRPR